jgi:hypothetical protein
MKFNRLLRFIGICLLLAGAALPARAKDNWINLHSKNFNVVSNASESDTRKLALKLEQFRYVVCGLMGLQSTASIPITVVVFKNDDSFKAFKPVYNGKPANVAGYFQRGEDENIIAINISANQSPFETIYHEYTHLLTSERGLELPLWVTEGIAEFYSTFQVDKQAVTLGIPVVNHIMYLRQSSMIPLKDLIRVDHHSPAYNERDKQGIFYAESWAFMYYMIWADKRERQPQFMQFIKLVTSGIPAEQAFQGAFQKDFKKVEEELYNFIKRQNYTTMSYDLTSTEDDKNTTVAALSEAETQYYLGDLLLHTNRLEEAQKRFEQALALDNNLPRAYEGLGMVARRQQKNDEAKKQLSLAATHGSTNYLAHYYYAEALFQEDANNMKKELKSWPIRLCRSCNWPASCSLILPLLINC